MTSTTAAPDETGTDNSTPLLSVRDLQVHFPIKRGILVQREVARVRAVDGISFDIRAGETLGLVGESGSGKTTAAKAVIQLNKPEGGSVSFEGQNLVGFEVPDTSKCPNQWNSGMLVV